MIKQGGLKTRGVIKKSLIGAPLVSIITPVFNGRLFLDETIRSVLGQTYRNIEYIIIDGGSTDGTLEIIEKYKDQLDYWLSEKDSGMYEAVNKGLKIASGDILAYLNSDDLYYPDAVKTAVQHFEEHSGSDLIYGNCDFIGPQGELLYTYRYPDFRWRFFISSNTSSIPQLTTFWRSAIHKKLGYFDADLKMCGDFDFFAKVGKCCRIEHLHKILAQSRIHNVSLTSLQGYRNKREVKLIRSRYIKLGEIQRIFLSFCLNFQIKALNLSAMFKKISMFFKRERL